MMLKTYLMQRWDKDSFFNICNAKSNTNINQHVKVQNPNYHKGLQDIDKRTCFFIKILCPIIDVMKSPILKGVSLISLVKTSLLLHYKERRELISIITTYKFSNLFFNDLTNDIKHDAIN